MSVTRPRQLFVCSRDYHIVGILIVGSVVFQCTAGYPTPPTLQGSRLPGEPLDPSLRLRTFNASGIRGLLTTRKYPTEVIIARVEGPVAQDSSFTQTGSSEPKEELPGFMGDGEYELKLAEENGSTIPSPSLMDVEPDFTPGLAGEPIDASPSLPNDLDDEREESPEFVLDPVPSSPCERNDSYPEVSPEFLTDPVLTPEPTDTSLISPDYSDPGSTPELLSEPALTPDAIVPSPTVQPVFDNVDEAAVAPESSATDPAVSNIEGLMAGAHSVGVAVFSLIAILSIVTVVLTVTLVGTYNPYRPFVTSTSLSDGSLDYIVSPRSGHHGAAGLPEASRTPRRYEAVSLERPEVGP